jgi:hypothetical protein
MIADELGTIALSLRGQDLRRGFGELRPLLSQGG